MLRTLASRVEPLTWLLFTGLLLLVVGMSAFRWLDPDEMEALQAAWKIYDGQRIYVDFFQLHHPFLYYALYPLFLFYGANLEIIEAARLFILIQLFAIYAFVYLIAREVGDRTAAAASVFFLAAMTLFTQGAIEVRPDVPMTLFGLAGVYLLLRYLRLRRFWLLVGSGLCLCLAFHFLQKAAILILLLGAVLLLRLVQRDVSLRELVVFGGTMLAGLVPYTVYLWLDGSLGTFLFFNYTFPRAFYRLFGPDHLGLIYSAARLMFNNGVIVLLFLYSVFRVPKDRRHWEVAFLGVAWLAWLVAVGRHWPHYYLLGLPFVAITAAHGLVPLFRARPRLLPLALAFTFIMPAASYTRHILNGREDQMARFEYLHAVTAPGDTVYDGRLYFNLFRNDADFFYFLAEPHRAIETMQALRGYHFDSYALIDRHRPKVISDVRIDVNDPRIANHYEPVPGIERMYVRRTAAAALRREQAGAGPPPGARVPAATAPHARAASGGGPSPGE